MAVWEVIKNVQLDLSGVSDENLLKLVKHFDDAEKEQLLAALQEQIDNSNQLNELVALGLRVAQIVVRTALV
jgi:uncharacterized protein (DUF433 family)